MFPRRLHHLIPFYYLLLLSHHYLQHPLRGELISERVKSGTFQPDWFGADRQEVHVLGRVKSATWPVCTWEVAYADVPSLRLHSAYLSFKAASSRCVRKHRFLTLVPTR